MPTSAEYMNLPFDRAIKFFKDKVSLPTQTWKDLWQGMHSRAFVVAGAMKNDLLADLRGAVDKALADGTTLADFRKDFDKTVARHGWAHKGGAGWRSAVIFNTNLSTAYAAGHYQRMTDPDVLAERPYFRYVASSSAEPRPEHRAWYNLVLPADDPFWRTHYPPNDWGCKCGVVSMSAGEVERLKKEEAGGPNPVQKKAPPIRHYKWTDKRTGEVHRIPKGLGPGWDYNVGRAAWGEKLSDEAMAAWKAQGANAWERLTPGDWKTAGRPEGIAVDQPRAKTGPMLDNKPAARESLEKILSGEEKVFSFQAGQFRHDILANARSLAKHLSLDRSPFLPFIAEALEDPYEVWLSFERHKGTGQVVLRERIIKAVKLEKDRAMLMVAQAEDGIMEAWTLVPTSNLGYLKNQRRGRLIWGRE